MKFNLLDLLPCSIKQLKHRGVHCSVIEHGYDVIEFSNCSTDMHLQHAGTCEVQREMHQPPAHRHLTTFKA